jgi:hypothetical protein
MRLGICLIVRLCGGKKKEKEKKGKEKYTNNYLQ